MKKADDLSPSRWEWFALLGLVYTLAIDEVSKNILWGILLAALAWRLIRRKEMFSAGILGASVLAWLVAGVWSTLFSIEPSASVKGLWDMLRGSLLLWVTGSLLRSDESRRNFLRHFVIATVVACVLAWWAFIHSFVILGNHVFFPHIELRSVGHFNQSGIYLAIAWLISVATVGAGAFRMKWVGPVALAIIGLSLLGTTSRTSIAVAGVGTIFLWSLSRPPRWLVLLTVSIVILLGVGAVCYPGLRTRLASRGSFSNRSEIWQSARESFTSRPWTGVGLNNFKNIHLKTNLERATIDHSHNLFMNTLAQMGIPGTAALVFFLGCSAFCIIQIYSREGLEGHFASYAAGGAWWIIVVAGISSTTLHHEISMLFFMTMGLLMAKAQDVRLVKEL